MVANLMEDTLGNTLEKKLVLYGSGAYHYYTYGLCKYADRFSKDYAYVHVDHHGNYAYGHRNLEELRCGAFVERILLGKNSNGNKDTKASTAFFVGSKVTGFKKWLGIPLPHTYPYILEDQLRKRNGFSRLRNQLSNLPRDVYLSFDLNVMDTSEIYTDYPDDHGSLRTEELLEVLDAIKQTKHIVGADILGFAGGRRETAGFELYKEIVDSILEA